MTRFILYLLESSVILVILYTLYALILRRETFFVFNRFYLIGILMVSLLFPLVSFDFNPIDTVAVERPFEEISKIRKSYYEAMAFWEFEKYKAASQKSPGIVAGTKALQWNWINIIFSVFLFLYALGVLVCLLRLFWVLKGIRYMIYRYPHEIIDGISVIKLSTQIAPFSFIKYVFVHDAIVNTPEFLQILAHEKIHIKQKHSIDLIFVQLLASFYWFNPVVWQLIKSLKTTHEYIADEKIINSGYSLVEYQAMLLKQLISNNSYGLVHNFNLSFLKNRITMMKNKKSGWTGKVKVAATVICTIIFSIMIIQCNAKLDEQAPSQTAPLSEYSSSDEINLPVLYERKDINVVEISDAINFNISGNKLEINGTPYEVEEIGPMLENGNFSQSLVVVMRIDQDQKMKFVREVQMELRKANQRKLLYLGQTQRGGKIETPLLLPPTPETALENNLPLQPENTELEAEANMEILKIEMGEKTGHEQQQKVYDFVKNQMKNQSENYVVSARFNDDDSYGTYLLSLVNIKDGFMKIYEERAGELFNKGLNGLGQLEFKKVREGIPMAISIAE